MSGLAAQAHPPVVVGPAANIRPPVRVRAWLVPKDRAVMGGSGPSAPSRDSARGSNWIPRNCAPLPGAPRRRAFATLFLIVEDPPPPLLGRPGLQVRGAPQIWGGGLGKGLN